MRKISRETARRIALGAQGFNDAKPAGRVDVRHFRRAMGRMRVVQLDSVNVCVRSHYMPFYSRLGGYDRDALDRWLNDSGENYEYWAHVASVLPTTSYPLWRWKMDAAEFGRRLDSILDTHPNILEDVYRQVVEEGPVTISDVDTSTDGSSPWWGWGPYKYALEVLFHRGRITATRTGNFLRRYDLPERVVPPEFLKGPTMSKEEAYRHLVLEAVRAHGIGTVHDIADYFRLHVRPTQQTLDALEASGLVEQVDVPGWDAPTYLDPEAARPRNIDGATLLTPFDPVVWFRGRGERLFDFHYRIEIYTPEPDRVFGYYSLPFLVGDQVVGRTDLKADRKGSALLVRSAWREEGTSEAMVAAELATELERFATWLGLSDIVLEDKGNVMRSLKAAM